MIHAHYVIYPVTGLFAHGQFAHEQFAHGQFAHEQFAHGLKVRLGYVFLIFFPWANSPVTDILTPMKRLISLQLKCTLFTNLVQIF